MRIMLLASIFIVAVAGATSAAAKQAIACDSTISAESIPTDVPLLIFGEIHGTKNAPEYVGDVICARLKSAPDSKLTVALELPTAESEHLEAYLESQGSAKDRGRLLTSPFWQRDMQDGRSSVAMLALIERLRKWQRRATGLQVVAFDPVEDLRLGPTRDEAMAATIKQIVENTKPGLTVVLVGNLHAKRTPGFAGRADYKTLASVLDLPFKSYNLIGPSGSYWACTPGCGENEFGPRKDPDPMPTLDLRLARPHPDYDGLINVGVFKLAAPAVDTSR